MRGGGAETDQGVRRAGAAFHEAQAGYYISVAQRLEAHIRAKLAELDGTPEG